MLLKRLIHNTYGFTLTELLIAVVVSTFLITTVSSVFILSQRVYRKNNIRAELLQNARIITDRLAREIRQAVDIVTTLPADNSDPALVAHELLFEDGHTDSHIQYIRYYLSDATLHRQIIVYYFTVNPSEYVHWNDSSVFGGPVEEILEDKVVAEFVSSLNFYGDKDITVEVILEKNQETIPLQTLIHPRNT